MLPPSTLCSQRARATRKAPSLTSKPPLPLFPSSLLPFFLCWGFASLPGELASRLFEILLSSLTQPLLPSRNPSSFRSRLSMEDVVKKMRALDEEKEQLRLKLGTTSRPNPSPHSHHSSSSSSSSFLNHHHHHHHNPLLVPRDNEKHGGIATQTSSSRDKPLHHAAPPTRGFTSVSSPAGVSLGQVSASLSRGDQFQYTHVHADLSLPSPPSHAAGWGVGAARWCSGSESSGRREAKS